MPGTWKTISPLPTLASGAMNADLMLLLTDGTVLVHHAYGKEWLRLTPDTFGDYATGTWSTELDMANTRQYFASGILPDGRVFAIGGEDSSAGADTPLGEVFNPTTNTWSAINKPSPAFDFVRGDCNGTVLADGRVFLGGASPSGGPSTWSKRSAIWDSAAGTWTEAGLSGGMQTKTDPFEEESWALLPDGSVLAPAVANTPQAQRYVPSSNSWVSCTSSPVNLAITTLTIGTTPLSVYETGPLLLLPNGQMLAIGGTGQTALYALASNSWTTGPAFPADTSAAPNWPTLTALDAPACLLPSGKVVVPGGTTTQSESDAFSANAVLLVYDSVNPPTGALPPLDVQPPLPAGTWTWQCNFLLLPTGQLLCSAHSNAIFLYTPDPAAGLPAASWAPANISVPHMMSPGLSYTLKGTQINGLSQAVAYGDDGGMATNYPIVQLRNTATGQVVYLRTSGFSTMGVATGSALQSCTITLPTSTPTGTWNLVVIANGIPSAIVSVVIAPAVHKFPDKNPFAEKSLKENLKLEHEVLKSLTTEKVVKESETKFDETVDPGNFGDPWLWFQGILANQTATIASLARGVDDLSKEVRALRSFIRPDERPAVGDEAIAQSAEKAEGKARRGDGE